ncbi:RING-H2 finger protein ATL3-like [Andrographis paniculata]|uniref:RING-H2 finger protein ATL3-like n=1 Tax=Andrographis paniculata TaxID=175694 RepID=UPI0021E71874|nr:RING-H2 finger protein ATL3-like [Andrographis paniculata]
MASADNGGRFGDTGVIELTGKVVAVALVLLFFIVFFVFCLHIYAKWFWYSRQDNPPTTTPTRRRQRRRSSLDFAGGDDEMAIVSSSSSAAAALRHGLDPWVLKSIPVVVFDPKDDGLECAVCLCEVSEGEKARLLPKCNHGFHVDCIDMWFESHSTCPLCRNPIDYDPNQVFNHRPGAAETVTDSEENPSSSSSSGGNVNVNHNHVEQSTSPNFPTNVLVWGDESQVRTFSPNCTVEEETSSTHHHQPNTGVEETEAEGAAESESEQASSMTSTSTSTSSISIIIIPNPNPNHTRQMSEEEEEEEQKVPAVAATRRLRSLKRLLSGGGNRRVNHHPSNATSPRNLDLEQGRQAAAIEERRGGC